MTGSVGVPVNLWVETTTSYERAGTNFLRTEDDVPTFGEINLAGADTDGEQATVGLKFTFKRNDNGQEVTIPFMQITIFDFDHPYPHSPPREMVLDDWGQRQRQPEGPN